VESTKPLNNRHRCFTVPGLVLVLLGTQQSTTYGYLSRQTGVPARQNLPEMQNILRHDVGRWCQEGSPAVWPTWRLPWATPCCPAMNDRSLDHNHSTATSASFACRFLPTVLVPPIFREFPSIYVLLLPTLDHNASDPLHRVGSCPRGRRRATHRRSDSFAADRRPPYPGAAPHRARSRGTTASEHQPLSTTRMPVNFRFVRG
jgi:hypothetical protein